jgi:hypothetical protein
MKNLRASYPRMALERLDDERSDCRYKNMTAAMNESHDRSLPRGLEEIALIAANDTIVLTAIDLAGGVARGLLTSKPDERIISAAVNECRFRCLQMNRRNQTRRTRCDGGKRPRPFGPQQITEKAAIGESGRKYDCHRWHTSPEEYRLWRQRTSSRDRHFRRDYAANRAICL